MTSVSNHILASLTALTLTLVSLLVLWGWFSL